MEKKLSRLNMNIWNNIIQVAQSSSLTSAAIKVGCSQGQLSKILSKAEDACGQPIFLRSSRSISLTAFGEQLLPEIKNLVDANNRLITHVVNAKALHSGRVVIYAPPGALHFLSTDLIPVAILDRKEISVVFRQMQPAPINDSGNIIDDFDILISPYPLQRLDLVTRKLISLKAGFYVSPDFIKNNPMIFDLPSELPHNMRILVHSYGFEHNPWGDAYQAKNNQGYICNDITSAILLSRKGLGVVWAPDMLVSGLIASGELIECFTTTPSIQLDYYISYKSRKLQSSATSYILDSIIKYAYKIDKNKYNDILPTEHS